ncbi:Cytochrome P450 82G1 [Striga hermonthica]|uniref:Flavonoid-6-hydroxylase n=1 Tax=Striga hermonthica TaxID=68872 RepID=A0A9N7NF89_STRHE|nr:Cytochrome P450 82G1 [Striga hermonthica]
MSKNNKTNRQSLPPQLPGAWPLIGHLHRLGGKTPVARVLGAMADKHGSIFSLKLGSHPAVFVSRQNLVKECFTTGDRIFASRPDMSITKQIIYKGAVFALEPNGPFWRDIRKIVTVHLFSSQQLEKMRSARKMEVDSSIADLYSMAIGENKSPALVDLSSWVEDLIFSVALRMLVGKGENGREERRLREGIKKTLYLSGLVVVSDVIPWLEWMDIGGYLRAMKTTTEDIDRILENWLRERMLVKNEHDCSNSNLMDVMISELNENYVVEGHDSGTVIKATMLILLMAGWESSAETVIWAVSLLLNNPLALQMAQDELDAQVGRCRLVQEPDIKKLNYLQAVVKETLRLYPPGPLAGPRQALESGSIGGYYVPKGTRLVVNLWKLHRDPNVWSDPDEFRPERFLEEHSNVGYMGTNFEYLPFGSGRRMCPGVDFALLVVHLALARLLQGFYLSKPTGAPVDMTEANGLALSKLKPLLVVLVPRLGRELYEHL